MTREHMTRDLILTLQLTFLCCNEPENLQQQKMQNKNKCCCDKQQCTQLSVY